MSLSWLHGATAATSFDFVKALLNGLLDLCNSLLMTVVTSSETFVHQVLARGKARISLSRTPTQFGAIGNAVTAEALATLSILYLDQLIIPRPRTFAWRLALPTNTERE
jgi:hypothetical protein